MFKIGDFSKLSRISIKMLRHYDEIGLLKPIHVDPFTGYRFYAADQLPRLNRIIALKDMGFSLEQIAYLLDQQPETSLSAEQLRGMLTLKRMEIEERLRTEQARLAQIESRLKQIEHETDLTHYDVVIRTVADGLYATARRSFSYAEIQQSNAIGHLFDIVERCAARHRARAAAPPLLIYYDTEYQEETRDVEVGVPLTTPFPESSGCNAENGVGVVSRVIPGAALMACVVHTGDYDTLDSALTALMLWISRSGYEIEGPLREVYVRFGADETGYTIPTAYLANTVKEFVTELQIPVRLNAAKNITKME